MISFGSTKLSSQWAVFQLLSVSGIDRHHSLILTDNIPPDPEQRRSVTHQKKEMVPHTPTINYRLKSEVSITLHCQLCSTRYTAF